jgi:polysaccharide export outer membrane protein
MRNLIHVVLLCVTLVAGGTAAWADEAAPAAPEAVGVNHYLIGIGDVLDISIWKDQDLSRQLPVLVDGTISLPLVGSFVAVGKTVDVLGRELSSRLGPYMHDPIATISVMQPNSMVIYVVGKVAHPGKFTMSGPVDVLQALAMAGGLTPFAKAKEIRIFRGSGDLRKEFVFDYKEVSKGEQMQDNIRLERGDTVVIR